MVLKLLCIRWKSPVVLQTRELGTRVMPKDKVRGGVGVDVVERKAGETPLCVSSVISDVPPGHSAALVLFLPTHTVFAGPRLPDCAAAGPLHLQFPCLGHLLSGVGK